MARRASAPKSLTAAAKKKKNAQIKATLKETQARRREMDVKVYHLKIVDNRISLAQREALERLFLEAKWLRNAALADQDFDTDYAKNHDYEVDVLVKTHKKDKGVLERRPLRVLGSQVAQSVVQELRDNLKSLSEKKKKGGKVGRLKFVSEVTSVNLKQPGNTYDINRERQRIRVQGIPGWMRVRGMDQLPAEAELSNAKIIRKPDGHYLAVTCFVNPVPKPPVFDTDIGVDFNIGEPLALSDGTKIEAYFQETDRLKRLQKKLARQEKGSSNYVKTCHAIAREYQKIEQRKEDKANKTVAHLLQYRHVYTQDDDISAWKRKDSGLFGSRKIQHGILGRVKASLKRHPRATLLDRGIPTTAWCPECHRTTPHAPGKNKYQCSNCGYAHPDRNTHAANNMILIGKNLDKYLVPVERGDVKPAERPTSAKPEKGKRPQNRMPGGGSKLVSKKQEAASSSAAP